MVSLPGFELDNIISSTIQEVHLLVHVLGAEEAEYHQFVPRSDGEVHDHQRLHKDVRVRLDAVGLC